MTQNNNKQKTQDRSTKYPVIGLKHAIEWSNKLMDVYGVKASFSKAEALKVLGYDKESGSTLQKLTALTYYGLLVDDNGDTYRNSDLVQQIRHPYPGEDDRKNKIRAIHNCDLFSSLIDEFDGQKILETPEALENTLIRKYSLKEKSAKKAVKSFQESIKFAGMYDNGIIRDPSRNAEPEKSDDQPASQSNSLTSQQKNLAQQQSTDTSMTDIPLARGVKVLFPDDLKLFLAVGKFANGIEALKQDIKALDEKNGGEGAQHNEKGKDTPAEPSSLREELEQGE